jgi:hypothetical protein
MITLDHGILDQVRNPRRAADLQDMPSVRQLLRHAKLLPENERMLVDLAVGQRIGLRALARIVRLPPGTVTRRLRRILARLRDPLVIAMLDPHCPLQPEMRQLGVEHWLLNRSQRALAETHRITVHEVRRMLDYIRAWHRGVTQRW